MKKTWKGINELIRSNSNKTYINQIQYNETVITDKKQIVNTFNDFFINVGPTTDREIPKTPISPLSFLKHRVASDFVLKPTSVPEVMTTLLQLDDKKSPGPSEIPINLLKLSAPIIVPHLVTILNLSLQTGIFPNLMKLAKVIPIFKSGSKLLVTNYRPISLLSVFSKIFEKIVHKQFYSFLCTNSVIYDTQFGFQKNKSTLHSLIEIVENIRNCMDKSNYGCGIFIDLKKAFDTVNHTILIQKLEHYGVRGKSLDWFSSYLIGRTQYTFCNNHSSQVKEITCGIPQGSVLGPLLFLLYINDLPNISKIFKFYLFADDTNIFYQNSNLEDLQRIINCELKKLSMWLNANRLALNISKTNFVIFAAKNKPTSTVTLLLNKKAIQQADYVKYLGILIDSQLTFKNHITAISKKISRITGLMYRIRSFIDDKTLTMIYYSLMYPQLLYGIPIWGNADDTHLNTLLLLQKKAVRLITNNHHNILSLFIVPEDPGIQWYVDTFTKVPSSPLFKTLKILKVHDIFRAETLKFVYDSLNQANPAQFHKYYHFSANIHNTASNRNNNLDTPHVRTVTYGLKSIKYTGCLLWNNLPMDIRDLLPKKQFSKSIRNLYIDSY